MKIIIVLAIFFSTIILIFLLPLYILVWQENILVQTIITTHEKTISELTAVNYGQQVIQYLKSEAELPVVLSKNEIEHMQTVKNLYAFGRRLLIGGGVIFFVVLLFLKFIGDLTLLFKSVKFGTYISLILLFIFGILVLMDFTGSFLYFHHIFFPQGNFLFPEGTLLIQIFSERFFKEIGGLLWLSSFILAGVMIVITLPRFYTKFTVNTN
jgi:hypothetical protein